jgi:ORF6N domain-containing protein
MDVPEYEYLIPFSKKEIVMGGSSELVSIELIQSKIMVIRGEKVMIDRDLAQLYDVETKQLKRAVRRNRPRFPSDFMFELTRDEYNAVRCQIGTLKRGTHSKYLPMAFTEQGVAMLSSVLNSDRAVGVNIAIMRAFVQLRKMSLSRKQLIKKLQEIEMRLEDHDERIEVIFEAIKQLIETDTKPRKRIGFTVKEKQAAYRRRRRKGQT